MSQSESSAPQEAQSQGRPSWFVTFVLTLLLGTFGAHRFYTRKAGTGALMAALTLGGWGTSLFGLLTRAGMLAMAGTLLTTGMGIWVLVDVILLLMGKFKDGQGQEVVRKPGEGLDVVIGLAINICLFLLLFQGLKMVMGGAGAFARFYRDGGLFMHPVMMLSFLIFGFVGFLLPYVFKNKRLPRAFALLTGLLISLILLSGTAGTFFGVQEATKALAYATPDQMAKLMAQYVSIAVNTEVFAAFALGIVLPLGALGLAAASISTKPADWVRGGIGALFLTAFLSSAYFLVGPKQLLGEKGLLFQAACILVCLLALALGLMKNSQHEDENDSLDASALTIAFMSVLGIFLVSFGLEGYFISQQCRALDYATADQKFRLMQNFSRYLKGTPYKLMLAGLASAAIPSLWLLYHAYAKASAQLPKLLAPVLVLLIGLGVAFSFHSNAFGKIVATSVGLVKRTSIKKDFEDAYNKVPLTASLRKKMQVGKTNEPTRAQTIPEILALPSTYGSDYYYAQVVFDRKMITVNRRKAGTINPKTLRMTKAPRQPFLPVQLHERLTETVNKIKKISKFNRAIKFRGRLGFKAHPQMPFSTLGAGLYSAHKAGYWRFYLHLPRKTVVYARKERLEIGYKPLRLRVSVATWPKEAGKSQKSTKHKSPDDFTLLLALDQAGAKLIRRKRAESTDTPTPKKSKAPKKKKKAGETPHAAAQWQETTLWQEARSGSKGLQFGGLQQALQKAHKNSKTLLIRVGLKCPYYELLGALDATGLSSEQGRLWLVPHTKDAKSFWTR